MDETRKGRQQDQNSEMDLDGANESERKRTQICFMRQSRRGQGRRSGTRHLQSTWRRSGVERLDASSSSGSREWICGRDFSESERTGLCGHRRHL